MHGIERTRAVASQVSVTAAAGAAATAATAVMEAEVTVAATEGAVTAEAATRNAGPTLLLTLALCAWLASPVQSFAQAEASPFRDRIAAIASAEDVRMRRTAIVRMLDAMGVPYQLEEFSFRDYSGTNIVVDIPAATATTNTLLLGAHYDRVNAGTGAVDNASGSSVLLGLLAAFKAKPLQNYAVRGVFFDLEERGLIGSQAYFAKHPDGLPAVAINFDIFAYGDTLFGIASHRSGTLATSLDKAAEQASLPARIGTDRNRYPASDHRIMMTAGIETLGLALIDGSEIDSILQPSTVRPAIMSIIHTAGDVMDRVRPADIDKAFAVVEQALRLLDAPR